MRTTPHKLWKLNTQLLGVKRPKSERWVSNSDENFNWAVFLGVQDLWHVKRCIFKGGSELQVHHYSPSYISLHTAYIPSFAPFSCFSFSEPQVNFLWLVLGWIHEFLNFVKNVIRRMISCNRLHQKRYLLYHKKTFFRSSVSTNACCAYPSRENMAFRRFPF